MRLLFVPILFLAGGARARSAVDFQSDCTPAARWNASALYADGTRQVILVSTGECLGLDLSGAVTVDDCTSSGRQRWLFAPTGALKNAGTSQCVQLAR